jgi:multidrug transporter EmrE-like cation transporter
MLFALLAGVSVAAWTVCLKLGSTKANAALGAMVITATAFLVNSVVMLVMRAKGHEIGLGLLAYDRGLKVTSSLIIGGTSTGLVLLVGFLVLHEPLTGIRLLAIAMIATGILLLQTQGA